MSGKYGARWYLHYDGVPPEDDDHDYRWTGTQWVRDFDDCEIDEGALEEWEDRRRLRLAEANEY